MAAFSLGADFIEKHFTDNRKKRTDYQSAMDENEIKNFINLFYQFKGTMGNSDKLNKHEIRYRKMFKKSIVFNKQKKLVKLLKK